MSEKFIKFIKLSLLLAAVLCLGGCSFLLYSSYPIPPGVLLENDQLPPQAAALDPADDAAAAADLAVRLLQASLENDPSGDNVLISPLSVLTALSMTANGAAGETLRQMEDVLGLPLDRLNEYCRAYAQLLGEAEGGKLSLANSIWFTDDERFTVEPAFLQTVGEYYTADIYQTTFDEAAKDAINAWVAEETDGMIEDILDHIPTEAVMYLVNALAFDAEWQDIYYDYQIRDAEFTREDGERQDIEMMYSEEWRYLQDAQASGFIKYYDGRDYAFAALLPDEGVALADYVAGLSGERLAAVLAEPIEIQVNAGLPKFELAYSVEMSDLLIGMGMVDAFSAADADLSGLGSSTAGNIFINRVLHKTFIAVDERGTRAGAATVVEATDGAAAEIVEYKTVILDRPFLYMLIDCRTNLPFFIGTATDMD